MPMICTPFSLVIKDVGHNDLSNLLMSFYYTAEASRKSTGQCPGPSACFDVQGVLFVTKRSSSRYPCGMSAPSWAAAAGIRPRVCWVDKVRAQRIQSYDESLCIGVGNPWNI